MNYGNHLSVYKMSKYIRFIRTPDIIEATPGMLIEIIVLIIKKERSSILLHTIWIIMAIK